jgi:hypothetical protein
VYTLKPSDCSISSMLCAVALSSSIRRTRIVFLSSGPPREARCPTFEEAYSWM